MKKILLDLTGVTGHARQIIHQQVRKNLEAIGLKLSFSTRNPLIFGANHNTDDDAGLSVENRKGVVSYAYDVGPDFMLPFIKAIMGDPTNKVDTYQTFDVHQLTAFYDAAQVLFNNARTPEKDSAFPITPAAPAKPFTAHGNPNDPVFEENLNGVVIRVCKHAISAHFADPLAEIANGGTLAIAEAKMRAAFERGKVMAKEHFGASYEKSRFEDARKVSREQVYGKRY